MRLLLDTHIWLWSRLDRRRLRGETVSALESPENELWLSPISIWELAMLTERGRVVLNVAVEAWIEDAMRRMPTRQATITHEIASASRAVDLPHQDPADRFLAATAKVMDLTLITADAQLAEVSDIAILRN
ncbi:MAG: type II toxin-antitoxin system VapC family toxin [Acidobacteria bacterium]|nr:type II toxin-antitoxin system VapC family toxin [Acidobacteriota bacterium]